MGKIHVIHGINLQLLGKREPDIYGRTDLAAINDQLRQMGQAAGREPVCRQTNYEGELATWIGELDSRDFLILNPGAWTHTNYSLYDAIKGASVPALEVHLSNIHAREGFRSVSVVAGACIGQISGLGIESYVLAMTYALRYLAEREKPQ